MIQKFTIESKEPSTTKPYLGYIFILLSACIIISGIFITIKQNKIYSNLSELEEFGTEVKIAENSYYCITDNNWYNFGNNPTILNLIFEHNGTDYEAQQATTQKICGDVFRIAQETDYQVTYLENAPNIAAVTTDIPTLKNTSKNNIILGIILILAGISYPLFYLYNIRKHHQIFTQES